MRTLTDLDAMHQDATRALDEALDYLAQAVADHANDGTIIGLLTVVDNAEATVLNVVARMARQAAYIARRDARMGKAMDRVGMLVAAGMDEELAIEQVTRVSVEKQRKRLFLDMVRGCGYTVAGFDEAVTVYTREMQDAQYWEAETFTRGHMVRKGSRVDPRKLWTMSVAQVHAVASDEMLDYFNVHGRVTRADVRAQVLSGMGVRRTVWGR